MVSDRQVRKLMKLMRSGNRLIKAAMKAGMSGLPALVHAEPQGEGPTKDLRGSGLQA